MKNNNITIYKPKFIGLKTFIRKKIKNNSDNFLPEIQNLIELTTTQSKLIKRINGRTLNFTPKQEKNFEKPLIKKLFSLYKNDLL